MYIIVRVDYILVREDYDIFREDYDVVIWSHVWRNTSRGVQGATPGKQGGCRSLWPQSLRASN